MSLILGLIVLLTQELLVDDPPSPSFSVTDQVTGLDVNFTKPIPCHSHNDYWRKQPLFSALRTGCIAVEADLFAIRDRLFVAHEKARMQENNTLSKMYLEPLYSILQRNNPSNSSTSSFKGVYGQAPDQTLVLTIDFKSKHSKIWPLLLDQLQPLRERGWLSHAANGTFISRPITVVATGNSRLDDITQNPWKDVFLDAPLADLDGGRYNVTNSYYASVSFKKSIGYFRSSGIMGREQILKVRKQIQKAHDLGLKSRYWGTPVHPVEVRNKLWEVLLDEGVDLLNADDLDAAKAVYLRHFAAAA